jgi:ATP-dependent Clp protease adapter protein ClpS
MKMSKTILHPEISDQSPATGNKGRWMVMIYNNPHNSFDEVIDVLMRATMCSHEEAVIETWEAHTYGKAPVHFSSRRDCVEVASVIQKVGVKTEVCPEWDD